MKVSSESEMLKLGQKIAQKLDFPAVIELVGDVGAGKTTFTRGLAQGLGIAEPVTSPSFTISKRYAFSLGSKCCKNANSRESKTSYAFDRGSAAFSRRSRENDNTSNEQPSSGELIHYDFYRLGDPGIMRDELAETLREPNSVVVIEWGGDVANLLPEEHLRLEITLNADDSRDITTNQPDFLEKLS